MNKQQKFYDNYLNKYFFSDFEERAHYIDHFEKYVMLNEYTLEQYEISLNKLGIKKTWQIINYKILNGNFGDLSNSLFSFNKISFLYEYALAHVNKIDKKKLGKYYTPTDVSKIMSMFLLENYAFQNIVDVACGTGNLIISFLNEYRNKNSHKMMCDLIASKKIWLYDFDSVALNITILKISILFGKDCSMFINTKIGDFLNKEITIPKHSFVISNPPYFKISTIDENWKVTENIKKSKDLYSSFFEKIIEYADIVSIVTPQSFLVSDKFEELRKVINDSFEGEIYNFDNVPCPLFNGQKLGIFNTNNANAIRASISYLRRIKKTNDDNSFRISHLFRYRAQERNKVINYEYLKKNISRIKQSLLNPYKIWKPLDHSLKTIINEFNDKLFGNLFKFNSENSNYKIRINTSARYFVAASSCDLDRSGFIDVFANDEQSYYALYAILNSSYAYMWYRMLDGGILFTKRILSKIKIDLKKIVLKKEDINFIKNIIKQENQFYVYKMNAGKLQQSIKFSNDIRKKLNDLVFRNFDKELKNYIDIIHNNYEL